MGGGEYVAGMLVTIHVKVFLSQKKPLLQDRGSQRKGSPLLHLMKLY